MCVFFIPSQRAASERVLLGTECPLSALGALIDGAIRRPLKAQNILQSLGLNTREVRRGAPEPGSWGGVPCSEGDHPQEASPPEHLVFVVHGIGESMVRFIARVCDA